MATVSVDDFRRSLDAATLAAVDRLRSIILSSHDGLTEHTKWNAPSFVLGGDDRITLGLEGKGGVRLVPLRGAKQKDSACFRFTDPDGLARWPTSDRGVVVSRNVEHVERCREQLRDLCAR